MGASAPYYIMTLPDERYRAVMWASRFLQDIAYDKKKYPRVPATVRQEAYNILRHYPNSSELRMASLKAPEVFQERMEPLTRVLTAYKIEQEEDKNE